MGLRSGAFFKVNKEFQNLAILLDCNKNKPVISGIKSLDAGIVGQWYSYFIFYFFFVLVYTMDYPVVVGQLNHVNEIGPNKSSHGKDRGTDGWKDEWWHPE